MITSAEVIASIHEIYDRFNIMPSLRLHMIRVAAVAQLILSGHEYDVCEEDLIAALLLHDLGNIVKFKLSKEDASWKKVQDETIGKYGTGDYQATHKMLKELGVSQHVLYLVEEMVFGNLSKIIESTDMCLKIGLYADQRVAPYGIVSLQERFADLRKRYPDSPFASRFSSDQEERAHMLEQQIFQASSLKPSDINDKNAQRFIASFSSNK